MAVKAKKVRAGSFRIEREPSSFASLRVASPLVSAPVNEETESSAQNLQLPSFAEAFPKDARLGALLAAYARGDYAAVRTGAPQLAKDTDDPAVKVAAEDLLQRISPDPRLRWMYLATLLLVVLVGLYWMRSG